MGIQMGGHLELGRLLSISPMENPPFELVKVKGSEMTNGIDIKNSVSGRTVRRTRAGRTPRQT